jgi:hypothetical protein
MKQLVLMGEGKGEVGALPALVRKLLQEHEGTRSLPLRKDPLRMPFPIKGGMDCSKWVNNLKLASRFSGGGAVLAVYDGDLDKFPPGSTSAFCAKTAAQEMAKAAKAVGAGKTFSLAIVFACVEFETWLIAGCESLSGKDYPGGKIPRLSFPSGEPEAHGKRWLEENLKSYLPARDQKTLTEHLELNVVRTKNLRSFTRLENALRQMAEAMATGKHICTPT